MFLIYNNRTIIIHDTSITSRLLSEYIETITYIPKNNIESVLVFKN